MTLIWLIIIPLFAGIVAWISARYNDLWPRWISLGALCLEMFIILLLWTNLASQIDSSKCSSWITSVDWPWVPQLGIGFRLSMDGLSLLMVTLTAFLGIAAVVCSWSEIKDRLGFFHFNLMSCLAGIVGVFLAMDLFLFYVFWEVMLIPMYFLIGIWGHENRIYASVKFFIFTQAGGLLMLMAILGLYFVHGQSTGVYTFNYFDLLGTSLTTWSSRLLMLGFFAAFAVKLPAVPFHTWLPDAHTEAPTAGSVILAGLLLKTGAYGLIRFVLPLFPEAAQWFASAAMGIGVVGIIYGALLAFAQTDLKRLVAYTSVSHLGFVLLGVFAFNEFALQGAVMQMICHGISTGALFILVGMLQERMGTRDLTRMGGLWASIPRISGIALFFALASLGLPGLGNFVGEFLVLLGVYQVSPWMAVPAAFGLVLAVIYSLRMVGKAFYGVADEKRRIWDIWPREALLMTVMVLVILWLGLFPQTVLNTAQAALAGIRDRCGLAAHVAGSAIDSPVIGAYAQKPNNPKVIQGSQPNK
ncbi:MAG: NADH-quinone oxidoreductase subunit M [Desulfomonilaceae bacterium]